MAGMDGGVWGGGAAQQWLSWGCSNPDQSCHVTMATPTHTSSLSLLVDSRVGSYVP